MTEPVPEPQINHSAIYARSEGLVSAVLLSVATGPEELALNLVAQELLDAFTSGFYAGIDAAPLVAGAGPDKSDNS